LKQVNDPAELEQSIKSGFSAMLTQQEVADAQVGQTAAASGNFTGTYTQEARVDEFDTVRYDGSHLYVAPRRYYRCCFFAPEAPGSSTPPDRSIRILETDPANGSASLTSTIPLEEGVSVQGMYVADERMFALTGTSIYGNFGDMWADVAIWAPEQLGYRIYDLSDPASPQLEIEATIDGVFIESRRIGNTIYIVSRYAAWIEGLDYYVTSTEEQASNQSLLDSVTLDDLLPKIMMVIRCLRALLPCRSTTRRHSRRPVITRMRTAPMCRKTQSTSRSSRHQQRTRSTIRGYTSSPCSTPPFIIVDLQISRGRSGVAGKRTFA
jgi:hypothetical protein